MMHKMKVLLFAALLLVGSIGVSAQAETTSATITLDGASITVEGSGATAAGSTVTITSAGTYTFSGILADGQIVVDTQDAGAVSLVLNGVTVNSGSSAAIYAANAESVTLALGEGTKNVVSSMAEAEDNQPDAAIYSATDLIIDGSGSLSVTSSANDGIASLNSIRITGAPVLTVSAGDDAIVAAQNISIADGSLTINAGDNGIYAEQDVQIETGTFVISTVGKAVHADYHLVINAGTIDILASDEGLEAGFITINDGTIHITASDDGINISEPDDVPAPSYYYLYINGGTIVVNAEGDGIDSNGSIEMTGGVVLVNGPTANNNGALDYDGTFTISGGVLVAAGSAGMPAAPGRSSSQNSVLINLNSAYAAGTLVSLQNSAGETLLTFAPAKAFQSIVISSLELVNGETYEVFTGGSSDGAATDGLYSDGAYTPGTSSATFTVSGALTQVGNVRRMR